jgi:hypothetical protein
MKAARLTFLHLHDKRGSAAGRKLLAEGKETT